jgi:hypothetical protein
MPARTPEQGSIGRRVSALLLARSRAAVVRIHGSRPGHRVGLPAVALAQMQPPESRSAARPLRTTTRRAWRGCCFSAKEQSRRTGSSVRSLLRWTIRSSAARAAQPRCRIEAWLSGNADGRVVPVGISNHVPVSGARTTADCGAGARLAVAGWRFPHRRTFPDSHRQAGQPVSGASSSSFASVQGRPAGVADRGERDASNRLGQVAGSATAADAESSLLARRICKAAFIGPEACADPSAFEPTSWRAGRRWGDSGGTR